MTEKQIRLARLRKSERLIRLAYDLEYEAGRMSHFASDAEAEALRDLGRKAGKLGRTMAP